MQNFSALAAKWRSTKRRIAYVNELHKLLAEGSLLRNDPA